jgi:ectoine hydroxylase-related dioxygenase (phytanoyl-CoA dioxygenase family)
MTAIQDDTNWSQFTIGQQIQHLELEGYLVLPDLLDAAFVERLKRETSQLTTTAVDYSVHQRVCPHLEFHGGEITRLVAHSPLIDFLREVFGQEIVCMTYAYSRSEPGHPGISIHTDGQPYGSQIFGYEGSAPVTVRVLYYLDDLTTDVSPFRVVPRSHLSLHAEANPYRRYQSHPDEVMVTARAGSAVLINHRVFHGNFPNTGDRSREMLAIAYRPAWAGPVAEVPEWPAEQLASLDPAIRTLFGNRNQREWDFLGGNKPDNMTSEAPGLSPARWERES